MLLYATRPFGAVVGHCVAEGVIRASADELRRIVGNRSAVPANELKLYLQDAAAPGAIEISHPRVTAYPVLLRFRPPQSWMWLRGDDLLHFELLRNVTSEP